jgi:hypothetical protein
MPLVTLRRNDQLGGVVIDSPPLNLFSGDLLVDVRALSRRRLTVTSGPRCCEPRARVSQRGDVV